MNIFHFYTKEPNRKSKPDGMVVAMDARTAAMNAAAKRHASGEISAHEGDHNLTIWVRMDETETFYPYAVVGTHTVQWSAEPVVQPEPEPEPVEPAPEAPTA